MNSLDSNLSLSLLLTTPTTQIFFFSLSFEKRDATKSSKKKKDHHHRDFTLSECCFSFDAHHSYSYSRYVSKRKCQNNVWCFIKSLIIRRRTPKHTRKQKSIVSNPTTPKTPLSPSQKKIPPKKKKKKKLTE